MLRQRNRVCSTQNLPPDIVREIFKHFSTPLVIPTPEYLSLREQSDVKPAFPWHLGHICSSWRTVFFSMYSEFWSTITIRAHRRYPHSKWNKAVSTARFFLDRTEGRPLSFSVDATLPCPPILDLFIAESTRWNSVSLCLHEDDQNFPLLRRIKHHIPQLRSLSVYVELGMPRDFPSIFEDVPALSQLCLTRLGNWNMDWRLLTRLELSREFNVCLLLHVLPLATNLEWLGFNKATITRKLSGEFKPVTLPRLRILEICGSHILQYLTTPGLEGLSIHSCYNYPEPMDTICSFMKRSSCSLQRLGVTEFSTKGISNILCYTPDIKVLSVCNLSASSIEDLMKAITCRIGEQALIPQLEVLRLQTLSIDKSDVDAVETMIESRVSDRFLHSVQELRTLVLYTYDNDDRCNIIKYPDIVSRLDTENYSWYNVPAVFRWLSYC